MSKLTTNQTRISRHSRLVKIPPGWLLALSVALLMALNASGNAASNGDTPAPSPSPTSNLTVIYVRTYTERPGEAGMGDRISIGVKGLSDAIQADQIKPKELVLYLDGRALKGVQPESISRDELVFKLQRTPESKDAWNALLGRPRLNSRRPVLVSVGMPDDQPIKAASEADQRFNLIVYRRLWAVISLIGLIAIAVLLWRYGRKDLFRDSSPPKPEAGKSKPYSLAKVQVAWWFFLVVGSFLGIYLITGEFTMSEQALILMGIGTGTALGAAMIDANKRSSSDSELYTLQPEKSKLEAEVTELESNVNTLGSQANLSAEEKETLKAAKVEMAEKKAKLEVTKKKIDDAIAAQSTPVSETFVKDLLTDSNGVSFHRFQMIVWTVVLGVLFLIGVYKDLAMPEFSTTMLALAGISAGTYLGFKIPEKQTE